MKNLVRMLFGTSKIIIDNMLAGQNGNDGGEEGMLYSQIRKIISVNIVYFNLGHGLDYIYHGSTNFVGMNRHDVLNLSSQEQQAYHTDLISKIYPEYYIIKVKQFDNVARNTLDEWVNFLKNEEIKDGSKAKGLIDAKEKLDVLKLTRERQEYDRYISNWRDTESVAISNYKSGELKGIAIGEANKETFAQSQVLKEQLEMAKKCIAKRVPVSEIIDLTGLTEEEIIGIH